MTQVIALTEELLATAKQNEMSGSNAGPNASASSNLSKPKENEVVCAEYSDLHWCLLSKGVQNVLFAMLPVSETVNQDREAHEQILEFFHMIFVFKA